MKDFVIGLVEGQPHAAHEDRRACGRDPAITSESKACAPILSIEITVKPMPSTTLLNVALFGPPGSGKGTQAKLLCNSFKLAHLSTGDLLRAERQSGSELGRRVGEILLRGELVPDDIVGEIVRQEIQKNRTQGQGTLFDGYPRNLAQLASLNQMLEKMGTELHAVASLELPEEKLVERLTNRRVCRSCQHVFNLIFHPPKKPDVCDSCGGELYQRNDDRAEVIATRLEEYHRQTQPVMKEQKRQGRLWQLPADQSIEEVQSRLTALLDERLQTIPSPSN